MVGPEYRLSDSERTHLVGLGTQPGFQVIVNICESEVEKFKVDMINADPTKPEEVLAKHNIAKAAAMFWARVAARINSEQQLYLGQKQLNEVQPDVTADLLSS